MKILYTFATLLIPCFMYSQVSRVSLNGAIQAPANNDTEGITLYNNTTNKGTITDANGSFTLTVAVNDRIVISALQYATFTVIVNQKMIDEKYINIYLNPSVNELDTISLSSTDLTGNLKVDAENIETFVVDPKLDIPAMVIKYGSPLQADAYSAIEGNVANEAFFGQSARYQGLNIIGGVGLLVDLIKGDKKKKKEKTPQLDSTALVHLLSKRFPPEEISKMFGITEDKAGDFLFFVEENGLTQSMLLPEKEMQLLQFLTEKATAYKLK